MSIDSLVKKLKQMQHTAITVGWHPDAKYPDGTPVAEVAVANEYGTTSTPARPFFRPALPRIKKAVTRVQGNLDTVLDKAGAATAKELKASILKVYNPALAPATTRAKESTKPLIDSGTMLNTIEVKHHAR